MLQCTCLVSITNGKIIIDSSCKSAKERKEIKVESQINGKTKWTIKSSNK